MVEARQSVDCFDLVTWWVAGDNGVELVPCSCLCGPMYVMVACVWASSNLRGSGSGCWRSIGRVGTGSLWTCVRFRSPSLFSSPFLPLFPLLSPFFFLRWSMLSELNCGAADVDHQAAGDPSGKKGRCCPSW